MAAMGKEKEKAQDEKNLKILRELAASPANKYCFDCQQRGPTYVNVTVGSFVCTSCSGLLRGLNPPHRVKSITMASYTSEEMEQIKNKGNEYCKQVWLGKYDQSLRIENEYQNIHKIREFMIQKYEDKKYYTEPEFAVRKPKPRAPSIPGAVPTVTRSQTTIQSRPPKPSIQKTGWVSQDFSGSTQNESDVFKDFSSDAFKSGSTGNLGESGDNSFADFSSAFGNSAKTSNQFANFSSSSTVSTSSSSVSTKPVAKKPPAPPPPDRYAALADLDNQLHQQQVPMVAVPISIPSVAVPSSTAILWPSGSPAFGPVMYETVPPNPFGNTMTTWAQPNLVAAPNPFQNMSQVNKPIHASIAGITNGISGSNGSLESHSANQNGASIVTTGQWPVNANQTWVGSFPSGQVDAFSNKNGLPTEHYNPWAQSLGSESANPFLNGASVSSLQQKSASNNPFL